MDRLHVSRGYSAWAKRRRSILHTSRPAEYAAGYFARLIREQGKQPCQQLRPLVVAFCSRFSKRPNRTADAVMSLYRCSVLFCEHCKRDYEWIDSAKESRKAALEAIEEKRSFCWLSDHEANTYAMHKGSCCICGAMFCTDRLCRSLWRMNQEGLLSPDERYAAFGVLGFQVRKQYLLAHAIKKYVNKTQNKRLIPFFKRFGAQHGQRHEAN